MMLVEPYRLDLPPHWETATLRFLATIETGTGDTQDAEPDGSFPFIVRSPEALYSSTYSYDTEAILTAGDGNVGEIFHHLNGKFHAHQRVYVLRNFKRVTPRYLYYFFSAFFKFMAKGGEARTTVDSVRRWMLTDMPCAVPPLGEQQAIADYLDHETERIDELIAEQRGLIETLRERRVARISRAVRSGLDESVEMRQTGIDWIGEVPAYWEVRRLKYSMESVLPGVWGSDPQGDVNDVPCVRVADFDRPRLQVREEIPTVRSVQMSDRVSRSLEPEDLLIEKSGGTAINPVGFVAMYTGPSKTAVYANFIARMRLAEGQVPRYWLYAHAASYATRLTARSVKQTTGIQNLDQTSYFDEKFPFPPADEQRKIAEYLDDQTSRIDALIAESEDLITLSQERRAALITAAVTGQIDVRTAA